jgi:hypothetical protein
MTGGMIGIATHALECPSPRRHSEINENLAKHILKKLRD